MTAVRSVYGFILTKALSIHVGNTYYAKDGTLIKNIAKVIPYNLYDGHTFDYDVGLIKVSKLTLSSTNVKIVKLPFSERKRVRWNQCYRHGMGKDDDEGRIVGGRQTSIYQHPYQVSIRYNERHICGGAIISKEWIITAAHCVKGSYAGFISIKAGVSDLNKVGTVLRAKKILIHGFYNPSNSDYDIALIRLEKPLRFDFNIRPVLLPTIADQYVAGSNADVTGWGVLRKNGVVTNKLREVRVPIVSNSYCSYLYKSRAITSRMLCAGYVNIGGKDACQGDSGGPLVQQGILIGIVSWGYGCAEPAYPGVYTRVAAFRSWIATYAKV
ncbi:PREDICTED: trypsin-7-like [Polistes dominula]|uniref:trypsin n=1 Tax=Polistes dominula TaxID=743375 RepID=A0ABM1IMM6_POLDO|nr:PREDICTED: trypsin-7-like [Polistes dominula]